MTVVSVIVSHCVSFRISIAAVNREGQGSVAEASITTPEQVGMQLTVESFMLSFSDFANSFLDQCPIINQI